MKIAPVSSSALALLGVLLLCLSADVNAAPVCGGAEGKSLGCCEPCSSCGASDGPNNGAFNTGFGNQGFANDGFNNVGDFNIGSANKGDCNLASGGSGIPAGGCSQETLSLIYQACLTHPTYTKCRSPPAAYGQAAIATINSAISKCGAAAG